MSRFSAGGHKEKTVTQLRQKKEKPEVLIGWKTSTVQDDTDIAHWAKKRQLQDCRPDNNKQAPPKWDQYLCTVIKKCRALENVQVFIDGSLSIALKPTPSHRQREPTKIKLKHSSSMPILKVDKPAKILEEEENEKGKPEQTDTINEAGEMDSSQARLLKESDTKSTESSKEGSNSHSIVTKEIDVVNGTNSNNSPDQDTPGSTNENVIFSQQDGTTEDDLDDLTERSENILSSDKQSESRTKPPEKPQPKFGYTRSNITLNIHSSFMPMSNGSKYFKGEEIKVQSDEEYDVGEEKTELETTTKLNFKGSLTYPSKRQLTERRVLHTTNLTHSSVLPDYVSKRHLLPGNGVTLSSKSESNISRVQEDSQVMAVTQVQPNSAQATVGMSIASLKSGTRVHSAINESVHMTDDPDSLSEKKMSQKQVMLVLKKVTLKDDLGDLSKDDKHENPFHQTHALLSSQNQKYELPATSVVPHQNKHKRSSARSEQSSLRHKAGRHKAICFPIGDLLPAVDTSIRNSMPARNYRSLDHPGLEKDNWEGAGGKENLLSYEDGVSMMKQGIEIIRVKSNILGPPAFRPQNGKTPLQRAKENANKRAYTNMPLSATQIAEVTDFSNNFWKSSTGSLYSNPLTRSRPSSRNEDEARARSSRLSRKWRSEQQSAEIPAASELQQVSRTLNSRLTQLGRQRGAEEKEMIGRETVT